MKESTMTYSGAQADAKRAEDAAHVAALKTTDSDVRALAQSLEHLSKAVGEIARQLKMAE
jgi:hypothetical protein